MLGGVITPFEPEEFQLVRAGYSKALGIDGTTVGLGGYAAWSEPGGVLSGRDVDSSSYQGSIDLLHPLLRSRAASLWGKVEFALRDATQKRTGDVTRDDRGAKVTASALGVAQVGAGWVRAVEGRGGKRWVRWLELW